MRQEKRETAYKKVEMPNLSVELLVERDGVEIIHHSLEKGGRWAIMPDNNEYIECFLLLSGKMSCFENGLEVAVEPGYVVSGKPISKELVFRAIESCEFIYISNFPFFSSCYYTMEEIKQLAIDVAEKDGYTAEHCSRIKEMSMRIGEKMKLSSSRLFHLNCGAFFHDIGKVKIPFSVLNKPGKLTPQEWSLMKKHPIVGGEMMRHSPIEQIKNSAFIVEQHHERYDGKGYPFGLKKEEVSIEASIVSVADAFDAMTTDRVYRKAFEWDRAVNEIRKGREKNYHPDVVDAFFSLL